MILFVAITEGLEVCEGPGTRVAELVIEDSDVDEEELNVVEPDNCEDREVWLFILVKPGRFAAVLAKPPAPFGVVLGTGP